MVNIKRLKLYNSRLEIVINRKEKNLIRSRAYKLNMTMSDYIRKLIYVDNLLYKLNSNSSDKDIILNEIEKNNIALGRD